MRQTAEHRFGRLPLRHHFGSSAKFAAIAEPVPACGAGLFFQTFAPIETYLTFLTLASVSRRNVT
jgi:hypothetical protein